MPNTGNGFFDNEATFFNSSTAPNIYTLSDVGNNSIKFAEPITYANGGSSIPTVAYGGTTTIRDAVVANNGMLWIATSNGIYLRKARGDTTPTYVNDSTKYTQITTGNNIVRLRAGVGYVYYADATSNIVGRVSTTSLAAETLYTVAGTIKSIDVDTAGNTYAAYYTTGGGVGCTNKIQLLLYLSKNNGAATLILNDGINGGLDFDIAVLSGKIYYAYTVPDGGTVSSGCGVKRGSGIQNTTGGEIGTWGYPSYTTGVGTGVFAGGPNAKIVLTKNGLDVQTVSVNDSTANILYTSPTLTYAQATLTSIYATYYQNQNWQLQANIRAANSVFDPVKNYYMYYVDVIDNQSGFVASSEKFSLIYNFFGDQTGCSVFGTCDYGRSYSIIFKPAAGQVFQNRTYTARLWEYNISTGAIGFLSSAAFNVLAGNTTGVNQVTAPPSDIAQPVSVIDGWTGMFGLGVNSASRFLFAVMWVMFITLIGYMLTKSGTGGAIVGFMPFAFFSYIGYVPFWFILLVVIILGLKVGWFQ